MKLDIIGGPGSGKSTISALLAQIGRLEDEIAMLKRPTFSGVDWGSGESRTVKRLVLLQGGARG